MLRSFGKIEEAGADALTFLSNDKYEPYLYSGHAGAVLVSEDFVPKKPVSATLIRVQDPYQALAKLMQIVQKQTEKRPQGVASTASVHPSVQLPHNIYIGDFVRIEEGAVLSEGCAVYPFCYIGANCRVGQDSVLYPRVTLYADTVVGSRCIIHSGAVLGADGFGFAPTPDGYMKIPQMGCVKIADDVEIGANCCIDRAVMGETSIGKGTKIDNLVQIAHNCRLGEHNALASQVGIAGSTHVGDWCRFGGQAGLSGHITIGNHVQLAGQTGVMGNAPNGARLMGSPAQSFPVAMRSYAALAELPQLLKRINALEKEVEQLKQTN